MSTRLSFQQNLLEVMEQHYSDETLKASTLHQRMKMSRSSLHVKVRKYFAQTPAHFIRNFRLQKARVLLQYDDMPIKVVAYQVGFRDPNYFSRVFRDLFGVCPTDFRRNQSILNNNPEDRYNSASENLTITRHSRTT